MCDSLLKSVLCISYSRDLTSSEDSNKKENVDVVGVVSHTRVIWKCR